MAKKEKAKKTKKKPKSTDKAKEKDPEPATMPPVRAHHNYEVSRSPFPAKITAERIKKVSNEHEQQGEEQQQKKSKSGGGGSSGGSGGGGGGGGDAVKSALQAIVAFGDDTGYTALDPRLADLLASAKKALQSSEE